VNVDLSCAGAVVEVSDLSVDVAFAAAVTHYCGNLVDTGDSGGFCGRIEPCFPARGKFWSLASE
jgi:hypothetical protein